MKKAQFNNTETMLTQGKCMEMITQGKSRKQIVDYLQEEGLSYDNASKMYYMSLKNIIPEPEFFEDYKKSLAQTNLDRLEKIIEESIDGTTAADKAIAIKAIEAINKMCGLSGENQINIAKNSKGDEIIQITFGK